METRKEFIEKIEKSFLTSLRNIGIELSEDAVCTINGRSIILGISPEGVYLERGFKMGFASEVELYSKDFYDKKNIINFGSSGSFTPSNRESYWRTIHAASILKNWDAVCEIVNGHCKRYEENEKQQEVYG